MESKVAASDSRDQFYISRYRETLCASIYKFQYKTISMFTLD